MSGSWKTFCALVVGARLEIEAQQSKRMKLQTRELHPGAEPERVVDLSFDPGGVIAGAC